MAAIDSWWSRPRGPKPCWATPRSRSIRGTSAIVDLHGKTVTLPLMDREIPIVLDDMADPKFGTGVVKVTPAHDPNDFEAGKRHNLPQIKVIDEDGKMTAAARTLRRPRPLRGAQARGRRTREARACSSRSKTYKLQRRQVPALQDGRSSRWFRSSGS